MAIFNWILVGSWAAFLITWSSTAWRNKPTMRGSPAAGLGIAGFSVFVILLHFILPRLPTSLVALPPSFVRGTLGSILCVIGIAYAIRARVSLGSNWGLPMSRKERPQLITSGPYARVRHPIYAGVVLALLGSAIVTGIALLLVALAMSAFFLIGAFREERHLRTEFPEGYPAYQARTKRFIPFLF
jgi:protein-S-isoprenylcysteine O-methyltransferase Ste14